MGEMERRSFSLRERKWWSGGSLKGLRRQREGKVAVVSAMPMEMVWSLPGEENRVGFNLGNQLFYLEFILD